MKGKVAKQTQQDKVATKKSKTKYKPNSKVQIKMQKIQNIPDRKSMDSSTDNQRQNTNNDQMRSEVKHTD